MDEKKSRIRDTPTLSSDADSRTNTNLKRKRVLCKLLFFFDRLGDFVFFGGGPLIFIISFLGTPVGFGRSVTYIKHKGLCFHQKTSTMLCLQKSEMQCGELQSSDLRCCGARKYFVEQSSTV